MPVQKMTPTELKNRLDAGENVLVIDVRNPYELELSSVEGFKHIEMSEIPDRINEIPKDQPVVFICRSGNRSLQVANFLVRKGFDNLFNLEGGILAWARDVDSSLPLNY